jgi:hypothetical protein
MEDNRIIQDAIRMRGEIYDIIHALVADRTLTCAPYIGTGDVLEFTWMSFP